MKVGFFVPNLGPAATPAGLVCAARVAEEIGYDSVWVTERLLLPTDPQVGFPGDPDGVYPEVYEYKLDPLMSLAYVAASTSRVRLGTSILNLGYYNPVLVGRQLTTLDLLSGGRLDLGVGIGWSPDEYQAVGVEMSTRTARIEESVAVLKAIWTEEPVGFDGEFFQLPESSILPKPVQKPHPPIYMGGFVPAAWRRAARIANGLHPGGTAAAEMKEAFSGFREMVTEEGRDPENARIVLRGNIDLRDEPLGPDRIPFTGSADEIRSDIEAARDAGADEIVLDPTYFVSTLSELLARMEEIWEWLDRSS